VNVGGLHGQFRLATRMELWFCATINLGFTSRGDTLCFLWFSV